MLSFSAKFEVLQIGDPPHVSCKVTLFFPGIDIFDIDQDAGLFHLAEFRVERSTEGAHGGGEVHVGIHRGGTFSPNFRTIWISIL